MTHSSEDRLIDEPSDWGAAQDRATMLRLGRLEPPPARRRADRWLAPLLVVLWVVSLAAHLLARLGGPRTALQLIGSVSGLVLLVLGFVWLFASGRIALDGTVSPTTPLSKADRRGIRRQLARKAPLDLEHADITLELAHRQQRLTTGFLALVAIELPNLVGTTIDAPDPVLVGSSITGLVTFLAVSIFGLVTARHLTSVIRRLEGRPGTSTGP